MYSLDPKMSSFDHSSHGCNVVLGNIRDIITTHDDDVLHHACMVESDMENNNKYSQPMVWIGIYIAVASFFCIFAMAADLFHGFRSKKLWFPSKYFTLNAASITMINVAMKLPVDLSSPMPSYKDQAAKLGSLALMCMMMANLMSSLASMNTTTLFANVIGVYSHGDCSRIMDNLAFGTEISQETYQAMCYICSMVDDWEIQGTYSEPMVWIGIYIAFASSLCILAMAADLWHGFRNKKLWFPSKYFSLNAASITVITVAMKLPVDLSSEMPSYMDQAAKLGSLAFMCTMMANLMPSLASMDNKTLLANIIGLSILVITMIVNIVIDINTGVVNHINLNYLDIYTYSFDCVMVAYIYMAMILLLLITMISSSLTIPTSKELLEGKYQAISKISFPDQSQQDCQMSTVEKLRQHVRRYWIMAETGSPQFVMASNPLSTASGVICAIVFVMNLLVVIEVPLGYHGEAQVYGSAYKWSILFILITQSLGVVVGTIAPIFRCFSVLSFKLVNKWDTNHLMVFQVEKYWTQKLYEWKETGIPFLSSSRRTRTLVYNSKNIILSFCIGFQKVIVVSCKLIWLIPVIILRFVVYCFYCWKSFTRRLFPSPMATKTNDINGDLNIYVLQIHNKMEFAEKTLKGISISMNSFILKAEKEQSNTLLKLLEKSAGFNGVQNFDANCVQSLLSVELINIWSLPVVTLTCIAVALPSIPKDKVKFLVISVGEGLSFTHLVEESLNSASEYVNTRKATMTLWHKVENQCQWLEITLAKDAFKGKTSSEILKWFANKAEEIVTKITKSTNGELVENPPMKLIAANSMYRITQSLLLRHQGNTEPICEEQLFTLLNDMIADVLSACFTNIPRVITMKCHESVIEKREASVKVAAKLLGKTTKIIELLEMRELPIMDPDKMAYVDEWRHYLKQSIP